MLQQESIAQLKKSYAEEKEKAFSETTAQDIHNNLRELEGDRPTQGKRWPWELLQNAVDAAQDTGVNCTFSLSESQLIFSHDGKRFLMKEIAHLIYHGTTKTQDSNKIRFGTGFISTHLLSRRVRMRGLLEEGTEFDFLLNREGEEWKGLERNMRVSENAFLESIVASSRTLKSTIEYTYDLSDQGKETASTGIEATRVNAPFLLALNSKLLSLRVVSTNGPVTWSKLSAEERKGVTLVKIQSESGSMIATQTVAVATDGEVSTCVLLGKRNAGYFVENVENIPKLYYGFPLATTEDFPLRAVINCPEFIPLKERDGLMLGEADQLDNNRNKELMKTGMKLFQSLVESALNDGWGELHRLAVIGPIPIGKRTIDADWLRRICVELINFLRDHALVEGVVEKLNVKAACLPYDSSPENLEKLFTLCDGIYSDQLPQKRLITIWAKILQLWSVYLGKETGDLEEAFTLDKLAQTISKLGTLDSLGQNLGKDSRYSPIAWLNLLLELVHESRPGLLETLNLIPSQLGSFKTNAINKDGGIDNELKEIAAKLGRETREALSDRSVTKVVLDTLANFDQETLLAELLPSVKKKADSQDALNQIYQQAIVQLFSWLGKGSQFGLLKDNFPVISRRKDEGEAELISRLLPDEPLLIPVSLWDNAAQPYSSIFPGKRIISNDYVAATSPETWKSLISEGLLIGSLFSKSSGELDDLMVKKLLAEGTLDEKEEHDTIETMELTSIAFLEDVIDTVRRSKLKASQFLQFLLDYVVQADESWLTPTAMKCSCSNGAGLHRVYPSKWLYLLKSREWVPITKNKEEMPTVENLAPFFQNRELQKHLNGDKPLNLLSLLGVSPSQIMIASHFGSEKLALDNALVKILAATESNVQQLAKLAEMMQNPSLRTKLNEAYESQERVSRNRSVGFRVENILRNLLSTRLPPEKFKVDRIIKGADITVDIDPDFDLLDADNKPIQIGLNVLNKSFKVEVKSTSSEFVRVTLPQAKEAVSNPDSFLLCVVEVPQDYQTLPEEQAQKVVAENAIFIFGTGEKVHARFEEAKALRDFQVKVKSAPPEQDVAVDTSDLQVRLKLGRTIWTKAGEYAVGFEQLVQSLSSA